MVLVFDLDGVVYLGTTPIPGAIESLNRLAGAGHALYYLTNNSTQARRTYADRLTRMGIATLPAQVMTSAYASGLYLRAQGAAGKTVYVIGESGLHEEMELAGLRVLDDNNPARADYVVAGLDRHLTYAKLRRAHEEISRHNATFVATNRDATYPMETGEIPGGGAMVVPLELSTGVAAINIGKPEVGAWLRILELAGVRPDQAVMVGDRPETDIMGARRVGMHTVLVLTGVATTAVLPGLREEQRPAHVLKDLTELSGLLARLES